MEQCKLVQVNRKQSGKAISRLPKDAKYTVQTAHFMERIYETFFAEISGEKVIVGEVVHYSGYIKEVFWARCLLV